MIFCPYDLKSSSSNYIKYQMTIITSHPINNYIPKKCFMTRTKQLIVQLVPVLTIRILGTELLLEIWDLTLLQLVFQSRYQRETNLGTENKVKLFFNPQQCLFLHLKTLCIFYALECLSKVFHVQLYTTHTVINQKQFQYLEQLNGI